MKRAFGWWTGFSIFAISLIVGLIYISQVTLKLEHQNRMARANATQAEKLRDSLWALDGWMAQILGDEAKRSTGEGWFKPLEGQSVSSPLVQDEVPLITFRFESDLEGTNLLVPTATERDYPEVPAAQFEETYSWVADNNLVEIAEVAEVMTCMQIGSPQQVLENSPELKDLMLQEDLGSESVNTENPSAPSVGERSQSLRNSVALKARSSRGSNFDANSFNTILPVEETGVLLPLWRNSSLGRELVLLRKTFSANQMKIQGCTITWPVLEQELLSLANPILPGVRLQPLDGPASSQVEWVGRSLGTIPVGLIAPPVTISSTESITPARLALGLTWLAVLGAIGIGFVSLRSSVAFGERRSRFASAVTHELRTPLTTFQLYSEMLADDMVSEEELRREYLETLRVESQRLSGLVESVLAYSRLEEGREQQRRESIKISAICDRFESRFERVLSDAGLELQWSLDAAEETLYTDPEAVGQILVNLIENAAKYASKGHPPQVELTIRKRGKSNSIDFVVRDHGPGISPESAKRIFEPFDRAGHESGNLPGAGLGLSIARALARDLGGELVLEKPVEATSSTADHPGASFRLTLPIGIS